MGKCGISPIHNGKIWENHEHIGKSTIKRRFLMAMFDCERVINSVCLVETACSGVLRV